MSDWLDDLEARNEELRQETRADIAELRQETRADIAELRQEMHAKFAMLQEEMRVGIGDLRAELRVGFAALSGELQAVEERTAQQVGRLLMWATGVWVATIAILVAVSGQFRR